MMVATDGECEMSWMNKCKELSEHVIILERKLLAMENLQQLVRQKDEELRRCKSIIHQYCWALQKREHQLMSVTQMSRAEDGRYASADLREANSATDYCTTKAQKRANDDPNGVQCLSEGALYRSCSPIGLEELPASKSQECLKSPSSQNSDDGNNSKPVLSVLRFPVSRDLVEKLMQQNARLKKVLKDVLTARSTTINDNSELNDKTTRARQPSEEYTHKQTQKRMKLWNKTNSSNKHPCLNSEKSLQDDVPDITDDPMDSKSSNVQVAQNSNQYFTTPMENQYGL